MKVSNGYGWGCPVGPGVPENDREAVGTVGMEGEREPGDQRDLEGAFCQQAPEREM